MARRSERSIRCDSAEAAADRVVRYDAGAVRKAVRTDAGFLRVPATITRTGILTYNLPNGAQRRELRLPEEVFRTDSLETLSMVPVTIEHPRTQSRLLDPNTVSKFAVGHVGENVRQDGEYVVANLLVTDGGAIKAIEDGKSQVSAGYTTRLEFNPGTYNGQPYDAIQRDIRYNHVAIVEAGRAGPDVRLHLDSAGNEAQEGLVMVKITIDGIEFEVSEELAAAFTKLSAKTDSEKAELQAKSDSLKADLEKSEAARADAADPAKVKAAVAARLDLERCAVRILGADAKTDSLSDDELRVAVVSKINPGMSEKVAKADSAYIAAAFDYAVASYKPGAAETAETRKAAESAAPAARTDSDAIREAFCKAQNDAWKAPLKVKD